MSLANVYSLYKNEIIKSKMNAGGIFGDTRLSLTLIIIPGSSFSFRKFRSMMKALRCSGHWSLMDILDEKEVQLWNP